MGELEIKIGLGVIGLMVGVIGYFLRETLSKLKELGGKVDDLGARIIVHEKDLQAAERVSSIERNQLLKEMGVLERNQQTLFRYYDELRGRLGGNSSCGQ